jgi:hypothetical protein
MIRHGGLWLFASSDTEDAARESVYRIGWHVTPFNERDDSWLRQTMTESADRELHSFLVMLSASTIGQTTLD